MKVFSSKINLIILLSFFTVLGYGGIQQTGFSEKQSPEKEMCKSDCSSAPDLEKHGYELSEDGLVHLSFHYHVNNYIAGNNLFLVRIKPYNVLLTLKSPPPDFSLSA